MFAPHVFNVHPGVHNQGQPDNDAMVALINKQTERRGGRPGTTGPLGEYIQQLPYRTVVTKGPSQVEGPLSVPVMESPENIQTTDDYLYAILEEIRDLPARMALELRTRFPVQPRESISFVASSGDVTVAAGTAAAIVSQVTQERFTGFLTHVGVNVVPGAWSDITWQIRVNGAVHPEFSGELFTQNNIPDPYPFLFELTQARTVELVAINSAGVDIDVQGVLIGWTEFMSTFKSYGAAPQTGIA
jgi:hypothetical protein